MKIFVLSSMLLFSLSTFAEEFSKVSFFFYPQDSSGDMAIDIGGISCRSSGCSEVGIYQSGELVRVLYISVFYEKLKEMNFEGSAEGVERLIQDIRQERNENHHFKSSVLSLTLPLFYMADLVEGIRGCLSHHLAKHSLIRKVLKMSIEDLCFQGMKTGQHEVAVRSPHRYNELQKIFKALISNEDVDEFIDVY